MRFQGKREMGIDLKDIDRFGLDAQRQIREQMIIGKTRKQDTALADLRRELKDEFDSQAERDYYVAEIWPYLQTGEITSCELHKTFVLIEASEYDGRKLREIVYTPDFILTYPDGAVVVVEVKSKKIKRLQRDYPVRRRLFIEKYCRPNGWKFKECFVK